MEHTRDSKKTLEVITRHPIEIVRGAGDQQYFQGYAAVWYDGTPATEYRPLPNVREHINRDAFDEVLASGEDIEAWYNHSPEFVLGSTSKQSLFLRADDKGLQFTVPYDASDPDHTKVAVKLKKGIATGASFQALGVARLVKEGEEYIRTIEAIEVLREVSIVNHPAYTGTQALIRSEIADLEKTRAKIMRARALS